jgi:hypothetical protein
VPVKLQTYLCVLYFVLKSLAIVLLPMPLCIHFDGLLPNFPSYLFLLSPHRSLFLEFQFSSPIVRRSSPPSELYFWSPTPYLSSLLTRFFYAVCVNHDDSTVDYNISQSFVLSRARAVPSKRPWSAPLSANRLFIFSERRPR